MYARATSLLSRAAGGALSPFRVKKPGAQLENFSDYNDCTTSKWRRMEDRELLTARLIHDCPRVFSELYMGLLDEP